jgi:hypothetical protein
VSVRLEYLVSMAKAYRSIVRQEKKYRYLYYKRICNLYLAILKMSTLRKVKYRFDTGRR